MGGEGMSCTVCRGYDTSKCPVCSEQLEVIECPECNGTGINHRLAFNIRTRQYVEVTPMTWEILPSDEDRAEAMGWNYCRTEENCPYCKGIGEVMRIDGSIEPLY
jgi:DnaJ-class molecular chaperone